MRSGSRDSSPGFRSPPAAGLSSAGLIWTERRGSGVGFEHRPSCVVPGDPAHTAPAAGTGTTDPDVVARRLDAPAPHVGRRLGERPRQVTVKNVPSGQAELALELGRSARFQAGLVAGPAQ